MNIHQVSVTYQPEQDRILVRISTTQAEEMRLWLTRRLTLGLWPALARAAMQSSEARAAASTLSPQAREAVGEFQREAALRQSDFATPYRSEPAAALPLGQKPLLVSEVRITPRTQGALQLGFHEKLPGTATPRGFQVELNGTLVHGFRHLLQQAVTQARWREVPDEAAADSVPLAPPRYLN